ncbi:ABC transporter permease [Actinomadura craniellae]|uniref:ABC transporter permease n=1 Tax=Actinomadura craniellae TaxID=2231787 RepID=A0A365H1I6_9ACTN|nr:ABC transporter permease [Actinomadura craniellae]RAY12898.1 ABC transporter permease [Actinomadura craniellae]
MSAALWTETVKFLRSRAPWATGVAFLLPVLLAALFVTASDDATLAGKSQALGITPDWPGFHTALLQIDAAGGFLLFGVLVTWMFGREFSDRTFLDLLALPTSRTAIVLAKFTVTTTWLLLLGALQTAAWLATGTLLDLPGGPGAVREGLPDLLLLLALTVALTLPVALAASAGRGYLPGVAATVALLVSGVATATTGGATWFPWAVPAALGGLTGTPSLPPLGLATVAATAAAGIATTALWWQRADH